MTELSFLIELLLNHDIPKVTKDAVAERIKEVEQGIITTPRAREVPLHFNNTGPKQAASTLAAMERHAEEPSLQMPAFIPPPIIQTPIMEKAMMDRQAMLSKPKHKPITTR